jgi:septal ring factor EnvC (AmiA/AmiB activator)
MSRLESLFKTNPSSFAHHITNHLDNKSTKGQIFFLYDEMSDLKKLLKKLEFRKSDEKKQQELRNEIQEIQEEIKELEKKSTIKKQSVYGTLLERKSPKSPARPKSPTSPARSKSPKSPARPKSPTSPARPKSPARPRSPKSPARPKSPRRLSRFEQLLALPLASQAIRSQIVPANGAYEQLQLERAVAEDTAKLSIMKQGAHRNHKREEKLQRSINEYEKRIETLRKNNAAKRRTIYGALPTRRKPQPKKGAADP